MILFLPKDIIFFIRLLGRKIPIILMWTITLVICNNAAYSQVERPFSVSGIVTDLSTGETLIGATVKIQGTDIGVASDVAGKFFIQAPSEHSILVVTFSGYTERQIPLEGKGVLD